MAKVLVALEDGYIPANLHYQTPNSDIPALTDGRLKVVTERTKWPGGYIGINSFGFGGANVHAVLKSFPRDVSEHPADKLQRLVTFAARTEDGVTHALQQISQFDNNTFAQFLLQENATVSPSTHPFRGYTVLNRNNSIQEIHVSMLAH